MASWCERGYFLQINRIVGCFWFAANRTAPSIVARGPAPALRNGGVRYAGRFVYGSL